MEFGPDHIHLFIGDWKDYAVSQLVKLLKGFVSFMMRKNHWKLFNDLLWGNRFWSSGYFYRTVGSVTGETIKFYIEQGQHKHWIAQKTLSDF